MPTGTHTDIATPKDLLDLPGTVLGTSSWVDITQDQVDTFAVATGDHQWIHVDPQRAKGGPFGGTIAHGYLTLSLAPMFLAEVVRVQHCSEVLNYGVNKVRFPAPVPVGSRVRSVITLTAATERPGGGVEATFGLRYEIEGAGRPPCIAETVYLYR
ncbi:MaoC family dehydratase [Nakamurella sp.]|uniref:MaoC family dehydratase n=1 Tax=Nakamurella sp. TaxID=1869182 RepID=UPI00378354CE